MLSFQKSSWTDLGYDFSSSNIASSSTTVFVSPVNNVESENNDVKNVLASVNIDKGKSILWAPAKLDKKETKNSRAKKSNNQKSKQEKQHLCHHCGATRHTRSNCYKWLATQQSNNMISSRNHNQFPSSFAPLQDLLKALMFLSNFNGFNSSPLPSDQGFAERKGSSKMWKEKDSKWFSHSLSLALSCVWVRITCVFWFLILSQSSFIICFV